MTSLAEPITGGCQCGAVRYSLSAPPLVVYACHCRSCQRQSGGAFVLSAATPEPAFALTQGSLSETVWTSDAGNQRYGAFCGDCGSRIYNGQRPGIGVLSLRAGTLDDPRWARPAAHIWTKSAQDWIDFSGEPLLFDGQPSDYGPAAERYRDLVADLTGA